MFINDKRNWYIQGKIKQKQKNIFEEYSFAQIISNQSIISNFSQDKVELLKTVIKQFSADTLEEAKNYGIKYFQIQSDSRGNWDV